MGVPWTMQPRPRTARLHCYYAQVLETKIVMEKKLAEGKSSKIAECLVGDSTGVCIFKARNEQGVDDLLQIDSYHVCA